MEQAEKGLLQAEKGQLQAEKGQLQAEKRYIQADNEKLRMMVDIRRTSTEAALAQPDDLLAEAFDKAEVVDFWLPINGNKWIGNWQGYAMTDPTKKETQSIQPAVNNFFQPNFPKDCLLSFTDTHSGWQKLTMDAVLHIKDRPLVELNIAAILEWVGQDESPFPDKGHKAKFVRDCIRLSRRCGFRYVHGIVSDLSRIVAVQYQGMDAHYNPIVKKTAIMSNVPEILSAFAYCSDLGLLGVTGQYSWEFPSLAAAVFPSSILGRGIHGTVFRLAGAALLGLFLKACDSSAVANEAHVLRILNEAKVPYIPELKYVSSKAFIASPIGQLVHQLRQCNELLSLGPQLVFALRGAHMAGFCHRDVRPSNVVYTEDDGDKKAILLDWAAACRAGVSCPFVGTTHYAAVKVLQSLGNGNDFVFHPCFDLESLVFLLYDLWLAQEKRPAHLFLDKKEYTALREGWEMAIKGSKELAFCVKLAREVKYNELAEALRLGFGGSMPTIFE